MDKQIHSIHDEPAGIVELTERLKTMGAGFDIITEVITRTYEIKNETVAMVLKQCNGGPVTMIDFAEELEAMRRRVQALGVAMLWLTKEHSGDSYVDGVHQLVMDLENNAHRLETIFDSLLPRVSN